MPNRIFYACHAVSVDGSVVHGAQSVGITTTFDLEPVFQLGQVEALEVMSIAPNVEITVSRALTSQNATIWNGDFLTNVATANKTVCIAIGDDTAPLLTSSTAQIYCTGAGISGVTYTFPVDGVFTEEVTFVAQHKQIGGCSVSVTKDTTSKAKTRQYYSGGAPSLVTNAGNLTNITISTSVGRENLFKLGQWKSYHSYMNLPAEVTVEFEVSATSVDGIAVGTDVGACASPTGGAFDEQNIVLNICGKTFSMEKCKLSSVTYGGGDTSGGNATINFTYTTYNSLTVS
jgi:hypothetical protein